MASSNKLQREVSCHLFSSLESIERHIRFRLALPVANKAAEPPWGYEVSSYDNKVLEPVESMFKYLLETTEREQDESLRKISDFLSARTDVYISPNGVRRLLLMRRPFKEAGMDREYRESLLPIRGKYGKDGRIA